MNTKGVTGIDIESLDLSPEIKEELRKIGDRNDLIEIDEVDQNNDGYLDFGLAFTKFKPEEFNSIQAKLFDAGLIKHKWNETTIKSVLIESKELLKKHLSKDTKMEKYIESEVNRIIETLSLIIEHNTEHPETEYKELPKYLKTLIDIGGIDSDPRSTRETLLNLTKEILVFLKDVKSAGRLEYFIMVVNAIRKEKITSSDKIFDFVVLFFNKEHDKIIDLFSNTVEDLKKGGIISDGDKLHQLLLKLNDNKLKPSQFSDVLRQLSKVVESLKGANVEPKEIYNIILTLFSNSEGEDILNSLYNLPAVVDTLKNNKIQPSDIAEFLKHTFEKAGKNSANVLKALQENFTKLIVINGKSAKETLKFAEGVLQSYGDHSDAVFKANDPKDLVTMGDNACKSAEDIAECKYDLGYSLSSLVYTGLIETKEINEFINAVADSSGDAREIAFERVLPKLLKRGIKDPKKIAYIIKETLDAAKEIKPHDALLTLANLLEDGTIPPEEIPQYIGALTDALKGEDFYLPQTSSILPVLVKAGIKDCRKISYFIKALLKACNHDSLAFHSVLHSLKEGALLTIAKYIPNPDELIETIISAISAVSLTKPAVYKGVYDLECEDAITVTLAMIEMGITDKTKIHHLIEIASKYHFPPYNRPLDYLPEVFKALKSAGFSKEKLYSLVESAITKNNSGSEQALRDVVFLVAFLSSNKPQDPDKLSSFFDFTLKYAGANLGTLVEILKVIGFELNDISKMGFSKELAKRLNNYTENNKKPDPELFQKYSVIINKIHDAEQKYDKSDSIREEISKNLSPKSAYLILALGGADLYTSSFLKIWDAQNISNIEEWINSVDREGKYLPEFILNLCNYRETKIFENKEMVSFFLENSLKLLESYEDPVRAAGLLTKPLDIIIPLATDADKEKFAKLLYEMYSKKHGDERRYPAAFLIKLFTKKHNLHKYVPELADVSQKLPETRGKEIPREKWLRNKDGKIDNTITAKLYFYPDENWYDQTVKLYSAKGNGWKVDKDYMGDKNLDRNFYTVFTKEVNGIKLRVILTKAPSNIDNRTDSLNDPEIDIIVHRGHSFHLKETFSESGKITASDKLMIGGGCGSFGNMVSSEFLSLFSQNVFLADSNRGEGMVTHRLLNRFLESVAKGCSNWNDCLKEFRDKGFVLPDDPAFMIGAYIEELKKEESSQTTPEKKKENP